MKRTLVIGDIHGGLKALVQVFERASLSDTDRLIFLGDYVDGWSESAQVMEYVMSLAERQTCIFIKGNHDVWCEEWLRTGKADDKWLFHGGQETVESYNSLDAISRQKHLNFLEQMRYYEVDELNRLYIHAGFTSMHGPQQEFYSSNFGWDRTLWEMALTMDKRIKRDSLGNYIQNGRRLKIPFNSSLDFTKFNIVRYYYRLSLRELERDCQWLG